MEDYNRLKTEIRKRNPLENARRLRSLLVQVEESERGRLVAFFD
ncbi:MAG: hypothetical protein PVG84_21370 [Desulfobacterales bacterium]